MVWLLNEKLKNWNYESKKNLSSESDENLFQKNLVCESDGFSEYMGVNSPFIESIYKFC